MPRRHTTMYLILLILCGGNLRQMSTVNPLVVGSSPTRSQLYQRLANRLVRYMNVFSGGCFQNVSTFGPQRLRGLEKRGEFVGQSGALRADRVAVDVERDRRRAVTEQPTN